MSTSPPRNFSAPSPSSWNNSPKFRNALSKLEGSRANERSNSPASSETAVPPLSLKRKHDQTFNSIHDTNAQAEESEAPEAPQAEEPTGPAAAKPDTDTASEPIPARKPRKPESEFHRQMRESQINRVSYMDWMHYQMLARQFPFGIPPTLIPIRTFELSWPEEDEWTSEEEEDEKLEEKEEEGDGK